MQIDVSMKWTWSKCKIVPKLVVNLIVYYAEYSAAYTCKVKERRESAGIYFVWYRGIVKKWTK